MHGEQKRNIILREILGFRYRKPRSVKIELLKYYYLGSAFTSLTYQGHEDGR
jgi:hypothetical protein